MLKVRKSGLSDGPVVKNSPANAGDTVLSLFWEDSTCCRATKAMHHNCGTCEPQLLKAHAP